MKTTIANPVNTTNAMGKKRKRPKNMHKSKKDEENILSKDIEDDNIRYMMDTKKNLKPREDLKSTFTLRNLRFKPQKYKGSFLPYHLRWIFNNNVKSNEIVLLNEIEGLENEINRLKALKLMNRECRKLAGLPFGITTNFCQCCHLLEKKKHECSHKYCNDNCPRKKAEELMSNLLKNNKLKEAKDSASKIKSIKNILNENQIELQNQNNNNNNLLKKENNNNKNLNKLNNKIILDKNLISNENINSINDINKMNPTPIKKRLIFGTVERSSKEKRSIFLVKSDLNMFENKINLGENRRDRSSSKNEIKKYKNDNSQEEEDDDDDDEDKKKDDNELNNYTVSIEKEEDREIEEVIDIKKENEDDKENEEENENKSDKNYDKDNDEDDVIIINQTSPHNNDNDNEN